MILTGKAAKEFYKYLANAKPDPEKAKLRVRNAEFWNHTTKDSRKNNFTGELTTPWDKCYIEDESGWTCKFQKPGEECAFFIMKDGSGAGEHSRDCAYFYQVKIDCSRKVNQID